MEFISPKIPQNNSFTTLFCQPYKEGGRNFKIAFSKHIAPENAPPKSLSCCRRFVHIIVGVGLVLPIINTILYLALRCFYKKPAQPNPSTPKETPAPNKVIETPKPIITEAPKAVPNPAQESKFISPKESILALPSREKDPILRMPSPPKTPSPKLSPIHPKKEPVVDSLTCEYLRQIMNTKGFLNEGSNNRGLHNPGETQGTAETRSAATLLSRVDPHVFDPHILRSQKETNHPFFRTLQFKRLGHTFNLTGFIELPEGCKISLEGFAEVFTIPMIASSFVNYLKKEQQSAHFKEADGRWILENMTQPLIGDLLDKNEISKALKEIKTANSNKVVLLGSGYDWHICSVLIYRDILIYCNRGGIDGGNGVNIYKIPDLNLLTEDLLNVLCERHSHNVQSYISEQEIVANLQLTLIHKHNMKMQKTGNCCWTSNKAVLRIFLTLRQVLNQNHSKETLYKPEAWEKAFHETKNEYKSWSKCDRETTLEDFLHDLDDVNHGMDEELTQIIRDLKSRLSPKVSALAQNNKLSPALAEKYR